MPATDRDERIKTLSRTLADIEKSYGKGSIMKLGERESVAEGLEVISTGSIALDAALGVGGIPKGRIVEVYGPESSGKTTLALHMVAEAQKAGGLAAYIDAEHALDPDYAKKLGVDVENLFISQPDSGEQALEICDQLVKSGSLDIIIIDSVAALVPKAEIDGEMGDSHVGLQARLMSQALRKMAGTISKTNTCVVFINQIRMKIGIMFGEGISRPSELVELATTLEIVQKSGSWFSYKESRLGQGSDNIRKLFIDNPEMADEIENQIREKLGLKPKTK